MLFRDFWMFGRSPHDAYVLNLGFAMRSPPKPLVSDHAQAVTKKLNYFYPSKYLESGYMSSQGSTSSRRSVTADTYLFVLILQPSPHSVILPLALVLVYRPGLSARRSIVLLWHKYIIAVIPVHSTLIRTISIPARNGGGIQEILRVHLYIP